MDDEASPILPAHIEETVRAIAALQAQHESEATPLERLVESLTAAIGQPAFLIWLAVAASGWALANAAAAKMGYAALDPPPFSWLQGTASLSALFVTVIILTTQRRADRLASLRTQLTLELAIVGEQKTAKVIYLLEESRRDNPMLANRDDQEASDMSKPANPEIVRDALASAPAGESDAAETPVA
jgi:uncharacterized membrane protein